MKNYGRSNSRSSRAGRRVRFHESVRGGHSPHISRAVGHRSPAVSLTSNDLQPSSASHDLTSCSPNGQDCRLSARKALESMQMFLIDACNFESDHMILAMSVLSVATVSTLLRYVNELRGASLDRFHWEEMIVRAHIYLHIRHPYDELRQDSDDRERGSWYEHCARVAHINRKQREAEHYLSVFVSRQLGTSMELLEKMSSIEKDLTEVEAIKKRIFLFNQPEKTVVTNAPGSAMACSLPCSPVQYSPHIPRSPQLFPIEAVRRDVADLAQKVENMNVSLDALMLPRPAYQAAPSSSSAANLQRTTTAPSRIESLALPNATHRAPVHAVPSSHAPKFILTRTRWFLLLSQKGY